MRRVSLLLALVAMACSSGGAPPPVALGGLGPEASGRYRVWFPPGYPSDAPYPVVYFLHDYFGGDDVLWKRGVFAEVERRIRSGDDGRFLVVAPRGDRGFWSDSFDGRRRYESWVAETLIPEIERRYPVRADRGGRAITGISMGGLGAVKAALRRPGLFAHVSSLSGALIPLDRESVESYRWIQRRSLVRVFGPLDGENVFERNDPRRLATAPAPDDPPRFLLRGGREDEYRLGFAAEKFAGLLERSGWPVEVVLEPGAHDWRYWRRSAVEVLLWHARRFAEDGR